jgi:hypothetical protein
MTAVFIFTRDPAVNLLRRVARLRYGATADRNRYLTVTAGLNRVPF